MIPVGKDPKGIAVGQGAVWVANTAGNSVTRINYRTYERKTIRLQYSPRFVTTGGRSVWLTATESNRLIRIDPKTREVREGVKTGSGPFALDVAGGSSVWVTLLNANGVQRVRFYPVADARRYRSRRATTPSCSARIARYERFWFCGRCSTPK